MCGIKTTGRLEAQSSAASVERTGKMGTFLNNYSFIVGLHVHALACLWRSEVGDQLQELVPSSHQMDPGI